MKVLLFGMPDTISALDSVMLIPNLGLCSIAGNLEGCEVKVADLALRRNHLTATIRNLVEDFQPDVVGLSAMSFQYKSACRVAHICRSTKPDIATVLGGYHGSLMYSQIGASRESELFDFLVRGEGEVTFQRLATAIGREGADFDEIRGLSFKSAGVFRHNPRADTVNLDMLKPPDRDCRAWGGSRFFDQSFDCVETSRGCTMGCRFCSIAHMYGRSIRMFSLDRVIDELKRLKARGTQGVFFVDDNITLDVPRLKELCRRIVQEGLNGMTYAMQASVRGIAADAELAPMLGRAGFRWVFLGIENGIARNLRTMNKSGVLENTRKAVSLLHENGIAVFGGLIVGNPEDTAEDIRSQYSYALDLGLDLPIVQCLTPYPETETRQELLSKGLITNEDDFSRYNGFSCNVRTEHLSTRELSRAMFWGGLRLYLDPRHLASSRFWRYRPSSWPDLLANNFNYIAGALSGRIFESRHTW